MLYQSVRKVVFVALMTILALSIVACGGSATPPSVEGPLVELRDKQFSPSVLEIPAGTTVTWWWNDGIFSGHDLVSEDFQVPKQTEGTFGYRYDEPGTYEYFCTLHPEMKGTVVVSDANSTSTAP